MDVLQNPDYNSVSDLLLKNLVHVKSRLFAKFLFSNPNFLGGKKLKN